MGVGEGLARGWGGGSGSNVASISTDVMTVVVFLQHTDNQKIFKWKFRSRNRFLGMIFLQRKSYLYDMFLIRAKIK